MDTEFGATGKGLHENITSVEKQLTPDMVKHMRYLATIRNKLVHEHDFNSIPDRSKFITNFDSSSRELKEILKRRGKQGAGDTCIVS